MTEPITRVRPGGIAAGVRHQLAQDKPARPPGREWVFTFGADHTLLIGLAETGVPDGRGVSLAHRYVTVRAATELLAREIFAGQFGGAWSNCYPASDPGWLAARDRYNLIELVVWT